MTAARSAAERSCSARPTQSLATVPVRWTTRPPEIRWAPTRAAIAPPTGPSTTRTTREPTEARIASAVGAAASRIATPSGSIAWRNVAVAGSIGPEAASSEPAIGARTATSQWSVASPSTAASTGRLTRITASTCGWASSAIARSRSEPGNSYGACPGTSIRVPVAIPATIPPPRRKPATAPATSPDTGPWATAITGTRPSSSPLNIKSTIASPTGRGFPCFGAMCMNIPGPALTSITIPRCSHRGRPISSATRSMPAMSSPTARAARTA